MLKICNSMALILTLHELDSASKRIRNKKFYDRVFHGTCSIISLVNIIINQLPKIGVFQDKLMDYMNFQLVI